jgi:hypothetical protein
MSVALVIPWRGGDRHREKSFDLVKQRMYAMLADDDCTVMAVDSGHERFHRGATRNLGVRLALEAGLDVAVVCDADTLPEYVPLISAVRGAAEDGLLHLPYTRYRALTERGSRRYMRGADPGRCPTELDWEYSTGGVFVIQPRRWFDAGGMDERFTGWGFEDTSFRTAADALLGPTIRHPGTIVHLWHPSTQDRGTPEKETAKQLALRYDAAGGNPAAVLSLIAERQGGTSISEILGDTP